MSQVKIDEEVRKLLPPLSADEIANLENKLKAEGCRERLSKGWYPGLDEPIAIDGHNRMAICKRRRIPYSFGATIKFASRAELIQWVIDNQLGRRNLTDERRAYYRGKEYLNHKQNVGNPHRSDELGQNVPINTRTSAEIAAKHNVNEKTIRRDAEFAAAVDKIGEKNPKAKEEILNGKADLPKAAIVKQTRPVPQKKDRKPKPGRVRFDFKKLDKAMGMFVREIDNLAKVYDDKESTEYRQAVPAINGIVKLVNAWKSRLVKRDMEK